MQYFQGKSVYKGIVMGPVAVLKKNDYQVKRARIEDPEAEVKRVKEAVEVSKKQLGRLYDKAVREVGEASAAIFEVHQMMLEDEDYLESMENMIRTELVNAEYAAAATGDNFAEMFAAMDDEYMKARSADVKDISERLVRNLSGEGDNDLSSMEPSVIVADDLSPSETVQMDKEKILAFVTVHGSTNSHTAILARMMNIPALIGVPMDLNGLKTGMTAVVDGFSGQVIFEPEEDVQKETEKRMQEEAEKQKLLEELKGKENVTPDGRKINIYANIGSVGDLGYVMENDAGGIGLFRSEFLYLGRNDFPTEEEQFQAYKQAVQTMAGKKVIIRTLDIGADKQVDYFNLGKEENPALGYRAIRICLKQPESDHFVEMENSVIGSEQGTPWRETRGWFAYKMKSKGKPVNAVRIESFPDAAKDADVYVNEVKIGSVQGKNALHTLLLPKELWKASEWEVKIMRGKSEVTPKFRTVRMVLSRGLLVNE